MQDFWFCDFQRLTGPTWLWLSFLILVAVFCQFSRFISLRNLDLLTLWLAMPGVLLAHRGDPPSAEPAKGIAASDAAWETHLGYYWLFAATFYFLVRCLIDLALPRRPRLEPNLNNAGLAFVAICLSGFLMIEVFIRDPDPAGRLRARLANQLARDGRPTEDAIQADPASVLLMSQIAAVQRRVVETSAEPSIREADLERGIAQSTAVLCHLLILTALLLIGWRIFESPATGMTIATVYLLVPVTMLHAEKMDHLLPAVFMTWAVLAFRYPWVAGPLFALAGMFVYPLFLLPLWIGFYWRRGALLFILAFAASAALLLAIVWWIAPLRSFMEGWSTSVAWEPWAIATAEPAGFWTRSTQIFRIPIFLLFATLALGSAFWPRNKTLGDLLAQSVALILGVQFWYLDRGGLYVHWYLPLLLLVMFRPNLSEMRPRAAAVPAG